MSAIAVGRSSRILLYAAGALLLLTILYQFSSLYYFPQYDGARYWGDEFGQIVELKHEMKHGYAAIPTGKGATVETTNGIIRGNSWLAAFIYGLPALMFYPAFDLVSIGRTVTAVLSLALLGALFWSLRKFGSSILVALGAIALLITNRSFHFASHTARLDIAAGLAVLLWTTYCVWLYRKQLDGQWHPTWQWHVGFGAGTFFLTTLSIHLLTLLGPVALFALTILSRGQRLKGFSLAAGGVLAVLLVLLVTYGSTDASFTLFGQTSHHIQSHDVLDAMPIFSPLSWSVQSSNLIQRFEQFRAEAPFVAAAFFGALLFAAYRWKTLEAHTRLAIECCGIIFLSWLQFQSSAVYYLLHMTPLMVFVAVMIFRTLKPRRWRLTLALGAATMVLLHLSDIRPGVANAKAIEEANQAAIATITKRIPSDGTSVLAQYPAVSYLHQRFGGRLMTTHFINFPVDSSSVDAVLRQQNVSTMVLYRASGSGNYSFEVEPLWKVAGERGTIDTIITGPLFDVDVDYYAGVNPLDTLYLVRLAR